MDFKYQEKQEWIKLKKEEIQAIIEKELEQNPEITSIDMAKKHRIPFPIVELLKRKIKNQ